ncbi:uncharacterized protein LOC119618017 [Kryptolebias marmoratus]|uniref:uncharacterized protein LOC119618017 n=1 Tax=Kryptolebias marmoratus TaxID=37003 RepID=UPI0018ACA9D7|nr:uncharacterized protein LOC119618017 [Kryptolebias marmoratus]
MWSKMISLMLLMLQFTAAAAGQDSFFVVRRGDDVTLPSDCVQLKLEKCDKTTWLFSGSGNATVTLFEDGKIHETKSDRLSVTENCSLVLKKVTDEDAGFYTCRQFNTSGHQQEPDYRFFLSVVTITEQKNKDEVMLSCSVSSDSNICRHTVKWLYEDKDQDIRDLKTSQSDCSETLTFTTPHVSTSKSSDLFTCRVEREGSMKEFNFRISPLTDETGQDIMNCL